jgi:hypothetical protein
MPAANVTLAAPVKASATTSSASVGAAAAARLKMPNSSAAVVSSAGLIRSRVPAASAPDTAPTAIAEVSNAYVAALPWNANRAISGRITWKLKDSVPTSAIAASGTRSSGVCATCLSAERSWPGARRACLPVWSS